MVHLGTHPALRHRRAQQRTQRSLGTLGVALGDVAKGRNKQRAAVQPYGAVGVAWADVRVGQVQRVGPIAGGVVAAFGGCERFQTKVACGVVRGVGYEPDVGQLVTRREGVHCAGAERKVGCKHIARHDPEDVAEHRKCACNAAGGFQCGTEVQLLV